MASEFAVFAEGLTEIAGFGQSKRKINVAAVRAINKIARDARARAAREIRDQVNLPARYVGPGQKRLYVSEKAQGSKLQAKITARARNVSLARFVVGSPKPGVAGVYVEVQPGKARLMRRAFVLRLPQGSTLTDTKFNLGLAIRLRPGERLRNKTDAHRVEKGLYLLYGPSVDQIFRSRDGSGVATDMVPDIERDLSDEFIRLLEI